MSDFDYSTWLEGAGLQDIEKVDVNKGLKDVRNRWSTDSDFRHRVAGGAVGGVGGYAAVRAAQRHRDSGQGGSGRRYRVAGAATGGVAGYAVVRSTQRNRSANPSGVNKVKKTRNG